MDIGKQEKSEQKIRDFKKISSKKDIFDGLIDLELYTLYINKYLNIREIEDFKKLVKENSELYGEDKEYEMMLSNLKYHRITGYVSCNNKSSDKDDKEQVKNNGSSRKEK